eukprot:2370108-Pleurochrysis_carterae.AAC.1
MKEGVRHWEFASWKESLMAVEGNNLLLKAVHRTAQLICFDHLSACTQVHAAHLPENVVARGRPGRRIPQSAGAHGGDHQEQHFAQQAHLA